MMSSMDGYTPPGSDIDLDSEEIAVIKGWLARGDNIKAVAERTGLKVSTVTDIFCGHRFAYIAPAQPWQLPDAAEHPEEAVRDAIKTLTEVTEFLRVASGCH